MHSSKRIISTLAALVLAILITQVRAEKGLGNCVSLFPTGAVESAPNLVAGGHTATTHLCERSGTTAFFALEYDSGKFAPLWVAYRITDTFGPRGCASMTRQQMGCHFNVDDVEACIRTKKKAGDPFHTDPTLQDLNVRRLGPSAFAGTGHDRGHMAPNSTFSWHACGAYKTFTMANMVAQWGSLNRQLWANLEAQVLFWGVREGPIFVVTGPIWTQFPADEFKAIRDGQVKTKTFPKVNVLRKRRVRRCLSMCRGRPGSSRWCFAPAGMENPAAQSRSLRHTPNRWACHFGSSLHP
jgi:DNA/RNA endonuclease G (NUC1)